MPKYRVRYEYLIRGEVIIEARTGAEAMADLYNSPDYGEAETVVRSRPTGFVKIRPNKN